MRTLVTGGAGYIGSHTVRRLLAGGHEVTVFDNLSAGHRAAVPAGLLIEGDLRDGGLLKRVMADRRIDAVVHFAASVNVGESVTDPALYYANNVAGSLSLLDACREAGVSRLVFSSTCATYGTPEAVPITEGEKQRPINPYGNTKLAVERALADFAPAYGLGCCFFRYFNAAGASPDGGIGEDHRPETHLLPLAIAAAAGRRPPLDLFGTDYPTPDGTCVRDYVHVDDLADAHALALDRLTPGEVRAFNLGTGRGQSVRQVIRAVEAVTGMAVPFVERPRRAGDPPELVADASLVRREWGWEPKYREFEQVVETAWNWHRTHPNGYGG
jgi:UDP-glucose-4-epimerase GalE